MTRCVTWEDWQRVRREIRPLQTTVLAQSKITPPPGVPRPLRSHRLRTTEEQAALADAVGALLERRFRSGSWIRTGPRRIEIDPARRRGARRRDRQQP